MELILETTTLPVPASRPRYTSHGVYNDARYRQYLEDLKFVLKFDAARQGWVPTALPVHVDLIFENVKGDLDNLVKGVLDASNRILWKDDRQIMSMTAFKSKDHFGIKMVIKELEPIK